MSTGEAHLMRDDGGFIGGLEVTVFAAVVLTVLLTVTELFGVLLARDQVARVAQFGVNQVADGYLTDADFPSSDDPFGPYDVQVQWADADCRHVTVTVTGTYDGPVTSRQYPLSARASQPVTLYRDFSPVSDPDLC